MFLEVTDANVQPFRQLPLHSHLWEIIPDSHAFNTALDSLLYLFHVHIECHLETLLRSLALMGFPTEDKETLRYEASNPVGDAVLLYGMVEGPLWTRVQEGGQ